MASISDPPVGVFVFALGLVVGLIMGLYICHDTQDSESLPADPVCESGEGYFGWSKPPPKFDDLYRCCDGQWVQVYDWSGECPDGS